MIAARPKAIIQAVSSPAVSFSEHPMQSTLHDHMTRLRNRAQELNDRLTSPRLSGSERNRIECEIRVAELALVCYIKAYEIEQKIPYIDPKPRF